MDFSQGWDTGFKSVLIYAGVIFFWLMAVEKHFAAQSLSVICMNLVALFLAILFFLWKRAQYRALAKAAEAEVAAILAEDD
jgi:hypothetical protein